MARIIIPAQAHMVTVNGIPRPHTWQVFTVTMGEDHCEQPARRGAAWRYTVTMAAGGKVTAHWPQGPSGHGGRRVAPGRGRRVGWWVAEAIYAVWAKRIAC